MDELLSAVLALPLEVLLEFGGELFLDVLARAADDAFQSEEPRRPAMTWLACMFLGVLAGGISVIVLPHPLFRSGQFHGISLVVAPVITGLLMSRVALVRFLRASGVALDG